jgi:hypothetical protein
VKHRDVFSQARLGLVHTTFRNCLNIKYKIGMNEFMLLFRQPSYDYTHTTPDEMRAIAQKWNDWAAGIYEKQRLSSNGVRLSLNGKVVKQGVVTDGPFVEIREILGSFIIIKAQTLDEALTFVWGCPALDQGGSVEVRPVLTQ